MKVTAFNGSPRKSWNTASLLKKALEGAASQGAETELIHLYDLDYKGCKSCFACKLKDGKSYGKCALNDDLTPILRQIEETDALILGSPIYLGAVTGEMRSFLERLTFPYLEYVPDYPTLFPRTIPTGIIYTMNVNESRMKEMGYDQTLGTVEMFMKRTFGASESLYVTNTYQFDDYNKVVATVFDSEAKAKRRKEEFPKDLQKAFDMGRRFTQALESGI